MQKILVRNAQTITVAGGKDYNDLENKPSINSVELEGNKTLHELGIQQEGSYATTSDLATKQDKITSTNKLSSDLVSGLSSVATSGSYNDLLNQPTIPSKTSDLTNDSGFISQELEPQFNASASKNIRSQDITNWNAKYDKPSAGIPSTDLSSAVQTSLGKADTAIQDISGKLDTNKVKNANSTTAGDVYDVRYINTMLGDIESLLGGI